MHTFYLFQESEITDRAIRSELLSMERLLVHTIYVRTRSRLTDIKQELQTLLKDVECKCVTITIKPHINLGLDITLTPIPDFVKNLLH